MSPIFAGIGLMGGAMLRDFAIVSTAYGVDLQEIKQGGRRRRGRAHRGHPGLLRRRRRRRRGFGYTDAVSMATIGAGAATYIVGPVTGTAIGASSEVIALSVAAGLIKAVLVMVGTPLDRPVHRSEQPRSRRWPTAD